MQHKISAYFTKMFTIMTAYFHDMFIQNLLLFCELDSSGKMAILSYS